MNAFKDWTPEMVEAHNRAQPPVILHANGSFCSTQTPTERADLLADDTGKAPKLERDPRDGTVGEVPVQGTAATRFLVRVTSIRKRLLDEDNLCEKYHVDCCRYAGILPGDGPKTTKIEVIQEKADPGAEECVRIEVFKIP